MMERAGLVAVAHGHVLVAPAALAPAALPDGRGTESARMGGVRRRLP